MEDLRLTAGLRYDYEEKEQSVLWEYQRNSDPVPAFQFQQDTTAQANFSALSPKLSIAVDITKENLGFITYSRGFRAGGLTPLSSNPAEPPLYSYEQEFSDNLEIGIKNTFYNNKLIFNAVLFYSRVTDVQVPTLILPDAVTVIRNTGRLSSKGGELEIKAQALKGLEVMYDLGITDATYEELEIAEEGEEVNLEGKQQIFTPEFTSMLALQYKKQLRKSNNFSLFVRGEWKALGKQYFDLANTIEQESYSLFNSHMGSTFKNRKLTIWGRNLFNKRYISYAYDFGAVHLGNPATFGVSLTYRK